MTLKPAGTDVAADDIHVFLEEKMGLSFMRKLREKLGGLELRIPTPKTLNDDHFIVKALGWDDAVAFCDLACGERISVQQPISGMTQREYESKLLARYMPLIERGLNNGEIARELGLITRWVRKQLNEHGIRNPNSKPKSYPPAVSNGGLTGLPRPRGITTPAANENRVSGL